MNRSRPEGKEKIPIILIILCLVTIFIVDGITPHGYLDWFFYIPVIFYSAVKLSKAYLYIITSICILLTGAGYFTSPPGISLQLDLINRIVGGLILWMTTLLLLHQSSKSENKEELESHLKIVLDKIDQGVVFIRADDMIFLTTKKFENLLGYFSNELINKNLTNFINEADRLEFILTNEKILSNLLRSDFINVRLIRKDKELVNVNLHLNIIKDDLDDSSYIILFVKEIASIKRRSEVPEEVNILKPLSIKQSSYNP